MLYVILGWDAEDSRETRPAARPDHLAHWKPLDDAGRVAIAGPMTDFAGSLLIVDFESEEAARAHIAADPYARRGIFARWEVHPFKGVLPVKTYGGA